MRLVVRGDTALERLALGTGLVPLPAVQVMGGMALSGVLIASIHLGLVQELAAGPATTESLATRLSLRSDTVRLLLEALRSLGYLRHQRGRYALKRRAKRWLVPSCDTAITGLLAYAQDLWPLWLNLPEVARGGEVIDHHTTPATDAYWHRYITGQYEMARLTAPEIMAAVKVPPQARTALDIAGGHGYFAAELCRRNPLLRTKVIDLPGSAAVGRSILQTQGATHAVTYQEADARVCDLGTNHDLVLCFNLIHHLQPDEITALFRRIHAALRPGGHFALVGMFLESGRRPPRADECGLELLFHLTSNGTLHTPGQLTGWLTDAGFAPPSRMRLRRTLGQWLYQTTALPG